MIKPGIQDLLKASFRSILKNKTRTLLTSLGIIIGVTSVILLVSIGNGLKAFVNEQFESLGSNIIFVFPGKVFNSRGGFSGEGSRASTVSFDTRDISILKRSVRQAQYVIPVLQTSVSVRAGKEQADSTIVATTADYALARKQFPAENNGRWFSASEGEKDTHVAVLGYTIATDLFGARSPLGRQITISGQNLKVIGVMNKLGGGFGGPSFDSYIYVPLEVGFSISGSQKIQAIQLGIKDKNEVDKSKKLTEDVMLKRYQKDSFSVFDQSQILSSINTILTTLTVALSGIAAISLVVGGIGIMNIMLVTVTERTKEIGLRKAIGAHPNAILSQFLIEAIILSGVGGLVGVILGSLGTLAISNFFPAKVTISSVGLAIGVSSIVGIIFGVAPARKASKLSPIDALRYE